MSHNVPNIEYDEPRATRVRDIHPSKLLFSLQDHNIVKSSTNSDNSNNSNLLISVEGLGAKSLKFLYGKHE